MAGVVFSWIRGQVSAAALDLLTKEISALPANNAPPTTSCACTIQATHGLPCRHILYRHLTGDGPLTIQQIHKHWWLWRLQEEQQGGIDNGASEGNVDHSSEGGGDTDIEVVRLIAEPNIPLNPHRVKGKGRPTRAIAATPAPASKIKGHGVNSTKRLPSGFEYELDDELATAVPAAGTPAQVKDCIWVANPEQVGDDSYEPGIAAPRASARFIDGLDALDPDFEDGHDAALAAAEAAAREASEDATALQ